MTYGMLEHQHMDDNYDPRVKVAGTGPAQVTTVADLLPQHRGGPMRVASLPPNAYDALVEAIEVVDGSAVRQVPGGGLDLSGWVIRSNRIVYPPQPHPGLGR